MTPPERLQDVTLAERLRAVIASMDEFSTVLRRDTAHLDGLFADAAAAMLDTVSDWRKRLEAAAALSVRGWLPIESAPTNKPVLLWNNETQELRDQVGALRQAIRLTLEENAHLADGEVCTLSRLKDALGET